MKKAAITFLVLFIITAAAVGVLFVSCRVQVTGVSATAADASSQGDMFNQLSIQVMENCVIGTKFSDVSQLTSPEDYQFITYTVSIKNGCFVPAEAVEVQVTPMGDDVLQIGASSLHTIGGRTSGTVSATILTGRTMHPVREINVSYYIFGKPFHIRTIYGK